MSTEILKLNLTKISHPNRVDSVCDLSLGLDQTDVYEAEDERETDSQPETYMQTKHPNT